MRWSVSFLCVVVRGNHHLFTSSVTLRTTCPQDRHFPSRGSPWDNKCTTISQHLWYNVPRVFMLEDKPCDVSLSLEKLADGRRGFLPV